jgi:integrase
VVPLNAMALGVLREMHAERKEDSAYLFPGEPDKSQQDRKKLWSRVRVKAGIPVVRLHDLSHTFASYAVARGLPLYSVGKLLGHANAATTAKYAHLDLSALREATNTVAGMLASTGAAVT